MIDFLLKSKSMRVRVAALIQDPTGKILLVQQQKKQSGYWLLPGGGIEFGESGEEALKRELNEELSLTVSQMDFLFLNESIDPNCFFNKGKRFVTHFESKRKSHFRIWLLYHKRNFVYGHSS